MKIVNCGRGVHQREVDGLEKLRGLPDSWVAFTNLDLALPGKGLREIDLIMVLDDRVLLVDLKDWKGPISSRDASWFNGTKDCGRSPVQKLGDHTRAISTLLKGFLTEQARKEGLAAKLPVPLVDAAVVLTRTADRTQHCDALARDLVEKSGPPTAAETTRFEGGASGAGRVGRAMVGAGAATCPRVCVGRACRGQAVACGRER